MPVLGNHDVDPRKSHNPDCAYFARFLRPGFPFASEGMCQQFFSEGFTILSLRNDAQMVLINTVVDHHDEQTAKRGDFNARRVGSLERFLAKNLKAPLRLAMMHHHPVLHTGPYLESSDVIPNGDALIAALKKFGCNIILHGHKHHPRLTLVNGAVIFAAGSFSANMGQFGSAVGNMFHLLTLDAPNSTTMEVRGTIASWTFQLMKGWTRASRKFSGFPHRTGFGSKQSPEQLATAVTSLAKGNSGTYEFPENAVLALAPELQFLTPEQYEQFAGILLRQGWKLPGYDEGSFVVGRVFPGTQDAVK